MPVEKHNPVHQAIAIDHRSPTRFHNPRNVRGREAAPERRHAGQGVNDIAHRAQTDDQDVANVTRQIVVYQGGQGEAMIELIRFRAALIAIVVVPLVGQTVGRMASDAHPAFEVATIRPTDPNDGSQGFHTSGRRIFIENETVNSLIGFAYGVHPNQIVEAPSWFGTDRYDIVGVPDVEGQPSLNQEREMLQKLLKDRFKLLFRRDKRELSVYAVSVAKASPMLAKSTHDPNGLPDQTGNGGANQMVMRFTNNSMADFAHAMQSFLDKPVIDQTGLAGKFDFVLKWAPDELRSGDVNAAPGVFTAVQEQLGLRLAAIKGLAEVLVIESVGRPSEN